MARYVIDAPTLLHLVDAKLHVDPSLAATARDFVAVAAIGDLLAPG